MSVITFALVAASLASLPERRAQLAAVKDADGRIYIIGASDGDEAQAVDRYDPQTNQWELLPPLKAARYGAAAWAGVDGKVHVVGGQGFSGVVPSMETFDPRLNAWSSVRGADLDREFAGFAVTTGGTPYVLGGETQGMPDPLEGRDTTYCLRTSMRFDSVNSRWVKALSMPTRRKDLAAVTGADGKIYALGGQYAIEPGCWVEGSTGSWYVLSVAEAFDPSTETWRQLAPMPTGRYGLMAAAGTDGLIYAIGGSTKHERALTKVEAYDPVGKRWHAVAPLPSGRWQGAATTGKDGRIYVLGGYDADSLPTDTMMVFDPATNTWVTSGAR